MSYLVTETGRRHESEQPLDELVHEIYGPQAYLHACHPDGMFIFGPATYDDGAWGGLARITDYGE